MKILPVVNTQNKIQLTQAQKAPAFCAAPESKAINWILKKGMTQSLIKFASDNAFGFKVLALAVACIIMRPITVMLMPGQKKEDKQYLAAKSLIAATIADVARLTFILPLGMSLKWMGNKAKAAPGKIKFPASETNEFHAFNFAVSEGFGFLLQIGTATLLAMTLPKVMSKILSSNKKKEQEAQKMPAKNGGAL